VKISPGNLLEIIPADLLDTLHCHHVSPTTRQQVRLLVVSWPAVRCVAMHLPKMLSTACHVRSGINPKAGLGVSEFCYWFHTANLEMGRPVTI